MDIDLQRGPTIIVVPVTLHNQWLLELQHWLEQGAFDIFPYTQVKDNANKAFFWDEVYEKSKCPPERRIILATIPVCVVQEYVRCNC
jgi:hypothetical protein